MARRRRWPDEGDELRGHSSRRRSISEWLEDEMDEPPRRSRRRDDEDDRFETIASAISMLEERLENAAANNPRQDISHGQDPPMQQQAFTSSLGRQLQALSQRIAPPQGTQTYLPAPIPTGSNVMPIEALRRDVQTLRNSIRHSNEARTLQGLEGEIRALNRKLSEGGVSNATRDIADIKARMDQLNRMIQDGSVTPKNSYLVSQLQHINENIARVQRPALPERLVEDIRQELAEATRKLVPLSVHDARALEKNIQILAERLDSLRARQPDNARLQALEEQLGRLTTQMGQTDVAASLERVERNLRELNTRVTPGEGAEGGTVDGKTIHVLRGFQKQIENVKANADAADKRMHQMLQTLQDVIIKVAEKGNAQKAAASAYADAAFGQRPAAKIVDAENEAQPALDLGEQPAAARRLETSFHTANAAKALYSDFRSRGERYFNDENNAANVMPFRHVKRYAAQGLLAAAGVVLVIGIYNMLGPIINGEQTATASAPQINEPAEAPATGLAFTAPKETAAEPPAMQIAAAEPTVAPQKLNLNLPAMPVTIGPHLRASAQNGDVRAFYEIGSRLIDGSRGTARDIKLGLDWLQLAAAQQHAPALYRIAAVYEKGQGLPRNVQQAVKNYEAAGSLGNRKSLHNLGALYASGIDGEPDFEKAVPLFKKAANLGLIDSQYNLAIIYVNGMGVKQDLVEAYKWFAIAAQAGDAESAKKRDEIGSRFDGKTLVKAKLAAQSFKAQALDASANEDVIPPQAWADSKPAPMADLSNIAPAGGSTGSGLSVDLSQTGAAAQAQ